MRRSVPRFRLLAVLFLLIPAAALSQTRVAREVRLMGTTTTLETYSESRDAGLESLERFIEALEHVELRLSTWRPESLLSRLNRQRVGEPFPADPELCGLVSELLQWQDRTRGAFDPAIGALIEAWGLRDQGRVPSPEELQTARNRSGSRHLRVDAANDGCTLTRSREILIDAGAFGKGRGLDQVLDLAERVGSERWMVNLGGQVMVHGTPPGESAWEILLAHPRERTRSVQTVRMRSGSLATSGGSESDIERDGQRLGHVLDPRSGQTVVRGESVVVWHERALVADVLSTALYVMGVDEGLRFAEENGIAAAFLIPHGDAVDVRATAMFEQLLEIP